MVFRPVLDEVGDHELVVDDEHWEVQLALGVQLDVHLYRLRQMVALFPDLNAFRPQAPVHRQLLVVLRCLDGRHFPRTSELQLLSSHALPLELEQLSVVGELLKPLGDVLQALIVFVHEQAATRQNVPCLFVGVVALQGLQHVVLSVAVLRAQHVQLSASCEDLELQPLVPTLLVQGLPEAIEALLKILLLVF